MNPEKYIPIFEWPSCRRVVLFEKIKGPYDYSCDLQYNIVFDDETGQIIPHQMQLIHTFLTGKGIHDADIHFINCIDGSGSYISIDHLSGHIMKVWPEFIDGVAIKVQTIPEREYSKFHYEPDKL